MMGLTKDDPPALSRAESAPFLPQPLSATRATIPRRTLKAAKAASKRWRTMTSGKRVGESVVIVERGPASGNLVHSLCCKASRLANKLRRSNLHVIFTKSTYTGSKMTPNSGSSGLDAGGFVDEGVCVAVSVN